MHSHNIDKIKNISRSYEDRNRNTSKNPNRCIECLGEKTHTSPRNLENVFDVNWQYKRTLNKCKYKQKDKIFEPKHKVTEVLANVFHESLWQHKSSDLHHCSQHANRSSVNCKFTIAFVVECDQVSFAVVIEIDLEHKRTRLQHSGIGSGHNSDQVI